MENPSPIPLTQPPILTRPLSPRDNTAITVNGRPLVRQNLRPIAVQRETIRPASPIVSLSDSPPPLLGVRTPNQQRSDSPQIQQLTPNGNNVSTPVVYVVPNQQLTNSPIPGYRVVNQQPTTATQSPALVTSNPARSPQVVQQSTQQVVSSPVVRSPSVVNQQIGIVQSPTTITNQPTRSPQVIQQVVSSPGIVSVSRSPLLVQHVPNVTSPQMQSPQIAYQPVVRQVVSPQPTYYVQQPTTMVASNPTMVAQGPTMVQQQMLSPHVVQQPIAQPVVYMVREFPQVVDPRPVYQQQPIPQAQPIQPNYEQMSIAQQAAYRDSLANKYDILRRSYPTIQFRDVDMNLPLETLDTIYANRRKHVATCCGAEKYKRFLEAGFGLIEWVAKWFGFACDGYAACQIRHIEQYQYMLYEMSERNSTSGPSQWMPEIRILILALINALVFIAIRNFGAIGEVVGTQIGNAASGYLGGNPPSQTDELPQQDQGNPLGNLLGGALPGPLGNLLGMFMGGNQQAAAPASRVPVYDE